jgi:hypothetical protein
MIYYNDELVNWQHPSDEIEKEAAAGIKEAKSKFFGQGTKNICVINYPRGKRKLNPSGWWEPKKTFALRLVSEDGMWRYSTSKPHMNALKEKEFNESFMYIRDEHPLYEDAIELIYFLLNHSEDVKSRRLTIRDDAELATKAIEKLAEDTDIRFFLFGKHSDFAKDDKAIRSVALAMGMELEGMSIPEIKRDLYEKLQDGQVNKDKFVNYDMFVELTQAPDKLKAAMLARKAINEKQVIWSKADFAWKLKGDNEVFLQLTGKQQSDNETLFVQTIMNDAKRRTILFKYMGTEISVTKEEVEAMKRPDLLSLAAELEVKFSNTEKNNEIADKIIGKLGLS